MNKVMVVLGAGLVLVVGAGAAVATDGFGAFGNDYELRAEVNGTGKAERIAIAWPGDMDATTADKDFALPWAHTRSKKAGTVTVEATGVAEGTTCRIVDKDVEVAKATAVNGKVTCTAVVKE
ncbi:MAG: hypothetical protein ABWY11_05375 [Umezawaea sp.]